MTNREDASKLFEHREQQLAGLRDAVTALSRVHQEMAARMRMPAVMIPADPDDEEQAEVPRAPRYGREGSLYIEGLGTAIWSLAYDVRTHTGTITMPADYCTDMQGAINLFRRIDPEVVQVVTMAGGQIDTVYERVKGTRWAVIADRPPRTDVSTLYRDAPRQPGD